MATLPNPFDSGEHSSPPQAAAAPVSEPVAVVEQSDLDAIDCIGEIFAGARKLDQSSPGPFDPAAITLADELLYVTLQALDDPRARDLPYVPQGLIEVMEPMPLFLRKAG